MRYLAYGDYQRAQSELNSAQRIIREAITELNRNPTRARQVFDTCLYTVRLYVETKSLAKAKRQARECRRLSLGLKPMTFRHTPEVRKLLRQVDLELTRDPHATLEIQSKPSNCLVRINGIALGCTPLSSLAIPLGDYSLQVECKPGKRGRIYPIHLSTGINKFVINTQFEHAVHSRPQLFIQYAEPKDRALHRMKDAEQLAHMLHSKGVLVPQSSHRRHTSD